MKPLPKWRRLVMSTPGVIITQSLTAIVIILLIYRPRHFSWTNVIAISVIYGVVMTIIVKSYAQKYSKSLGLSNQQQGWILAQAIKKAEVPTDMEAKRALPAFIDRRTRFIDRQRKFLPFYFCLFGLMLLISIFSRNLFEIACFGLILGFGLYSHFSYIKTENNIAILQAELGKQGNKLNREAEVKNNEWDRSISQARNSVWIIVSVLLLFLVVLVIS